MAEIKMPPLRHAARCFRLRCQSKRGSNLSMDDSNFVHQMYKKFPAWYSATEANVFNATIPFGGGGKQPTTLPDPE